MSASPNLQVQQREPKTIYFFVTTFLGCDFCDFRLDEACRKVSKRNHPVDAKKTRY